MAIYRISKELAKTAAKTQARSLVWQRAGQTDFLITEHTRKRLVEWKGADVAKDCRAFEPDPNDWADAKNRLHFGPAAAVADALPRETAEEVHLYLYANPGVELEYHGRGRFANEAHLPGSKSNLVTFDIAGGRRCYLFRRLEAKQGALDDRIARIREEYEGVSKWLTDPTAKLVVSIGGGGFRLFAATAVLKTLDLLGGSRLNVAEVWGSSGGAFLGYVYASGFDLRVVDELGYDLYHGRHEHLVDGSTTGLIKNNLKLLTDRFRRRNNGPSEMAGWFAELDRKQPPDARKHPRLPFYSAASNPAVRRITALAEPEHIPSYCEDIIFPCRAVDAVSASTAVPFVLRAQSGITGRGENDTWVDGSITDENPMLLPYIKWTRERRHDPEKTRPRLKILQINLNLRTTQSSAVRTLSNAPVLKHIGVITRVASLMDMLLDSKNHAALQLLIESGDVEVLEVKLNLGWLSMKDPAEIPSAIRGGCSRNAWDVTTSRRGL